MSYRNICHSLVSHIHGGYETNLQDEIVQNVYSLCLFYFVCTYIATYILISSNISTPYSIALFSRLK